MNKNSKIKPIITSKKNNFNIPKTLNIKNKK